MYNNSLPCQVMTPVDSCHYHCIKDGCAHVHVTDTYLLTCDTCGCLTLDQGIRSHGVDTS